MLGKLKSDMTQSSIPSQIYPQHNNTNKEMVNNTNDLNPMIMMSGEEGSPSQVTSQINLTNLTHPGFANDT